MEEKKKEKQSRKKDVNDVHAKRNRLKELSRSLVAARNAGQYVGNEDDTVNGMLRFYYACKGYKNLKTFHEWKQEGFSVNKGEKALLVWGRPVSSKSKEDRKDDKNGMTEEENDIDDYFPICYLFAECQVSKKS